MKRSSKPIQEGSYVALAKSCCLACGTTFDNGTPLINTKFQPIKQDQEVVSWAFCPEHKTIIDEGYIALVGVDPSKSEAPMTPATVYRTGDLLFIREEVAKAVFNVPINGPMVYVDAEVIPTLRAMQSPAEDV